MKWKFNRSEFDALYAIIEAVLFAKWSDEIYDKILQALLHKVYKKMYKMRIDVKPSYTVELKAEECLTLYECLILHGLADVSFEGNLINKLMADIDQQFAVTASNQLTGITNNQKLLQ